MMSELSRSRKNNNCGICQVMAYFACVAVLATFLLLPSFGAEESTLQERELASQKGAATHWQAGDSAQSASKAGVTLRVASSPPTSATRSRRSLPRHDLAHLPIAAQSLFRTPAGVLSPYDAFDYESRPFDGTGWHGEVQILADLVREVRPRVAIEVGSWLGQSARFIARQMLKYSASRGDVLLYTVDTWLGADVTMTYRLTLEGSGPILDMKLQHGYPSVYLQFLANTMHAQLQDVIVPVPQSSVQGAKFFFAAGVKAGLVHIDASHEYENVLEDMNYYWHILDGPGSAMIGDDYSSVFPGVQAAVEEFAIKHCAPGVAAVEVYAPKWVLRKASCTGINATKSGGPRVPMPAPVVLPPADKWSAAVPLVHVAVDAV